MTITAPAPKNLWTFIAPVCWLGLIFSAAITVVEKVILIALYLVLLGDSLRRLRANDSITVNADSLSVRVYSGFFFHRKVFQAEEIKFLCFYPAFPGWRTSFGAAIMVKSRMVPLLHIQGQEAADVFDELS